MTGSQKVRGSNPLISTTSEWTSLHSDFSLQKNQSYAPSFLLFRKRSHSRRLFGCKRPHNAFGSLPTFLRLCLRHEYLYGSALSCRNGLRSIPIFLCRKISHMLRHSSSFAKRHARLACSLASALSTTHCRYHLFASMPAARISLCFGTARR